MLPYVPTPNDESFIPAYLWPLALTDVTNLIFDASFTCFALPCTFPLAIEQGEVDGLNQKFAKSKARQLGADHIPHPLIDIATNASPTHH